MALKNVELSQHTHITTSGGLISAAFIENIRELRTRQRGTEPASFGLPWRPPPRTAAALEEEMAAAWELLLERWDAVRRDLHRMDVSQARARWLIPLFQVLDFDPVYLRGDTVLDEKGHLRFPLSHRGWNGPPAPVLHMVAPSQDLDARTGTGRGVKAKSPHDMLQAFLNASADDHWAVLTNGIFLRLLRDYHHTFTKGYVQFDLEAIFETRNYADFRALYRMCHASRFLPQGKDDDALPPLERFYKESIATGIKVGEDLRGQVRQAIETLANGFLDGDLIRQLQADPDLCRHYYGEILHIIYRILFLLFAEQRGLLPRHGAPLADLYRSEYSITALRARAEGDIPEEDRFTDLWEGLRVTFRMVREGAPELGVFGYDGMLFEDLDVLAAEAGRVSLLSGRACPNSALLKAIRALTLVEREGVLLRISYADLGVEELGSIYESLLDYTPRVSPGTEKVGEREIPPNTFYLDPRGSERKTTGSYYTHPSLVNELIKSALVPVIEERLEEVRRVANSEWRAVRSEWPRLCRAWGVGSEVGEEVDARENLSGEDVYVRQLVSRLGRVAAGHGPGGGHVRTSIPGPAPQSATQDDEIAQLWDATPFATRYALLAEPALLSIKVLDPAAGSGHFLVAANNVLAAELARVRTGEEYPDEEAIQTARRDVLAHCIYAVDLNPMAVELCKVSLWINASVRDKPLSFLDHHIKCGNSLIGATPDCIATGIPTEAFDPVSGDNKATVKSIRARNRKEWSGNVPLGLGVTVIESMADLERRRRLQHLAEELPREAREAYAEYVTAADYQRRKLEADFWTVAFFWPMDGDADPAPTNGQFVRLRTEGPEAVDPRLLAKVQELAEEYRFFHWHLEFPEVFEERMANSERRMDGTQQPFAVRHSPFASGGGFDVILGNPPWERIKLQEKEFFASRDPKIATVRTAAERRELIKQLPQTNPALAAEYAVALRRSECESKFIRNSGRYPLTGVGDVNTYAVFVELARSLINERGRVGMVVASGIATDYTYREFFQDLMEQQALVSLYDFENRQGLFPGTHRSYKFALFTLAGGRVPAADFAFFLHTVDDLADEERHFTLTREDLALINPNTRTCPVFRTRRDAELTRKLYRAAPVLVDKRTGKNPWGVHLTTMFHSSSASGLFRSYTDLETIDATFVPPSRFKHNEHIYLPLYEGKMFMQYDHRFAGVVVDSRNIKRPAIPHETTLDEKKNPYFSPLPRFWVSKYAVIENIREHDYLLAFKKVTSPTNERTLISSILPFVAATDSIHIVLISPKRLSVELCCLLANFNSMVLDFVVRQKLGGVNLNFWVLEQLPVLPLSRYTLDLLTFIVPRVLELTYTAWDIKPFADDVWRDAANSEQRTGNGDHSPFAIPLSPLQEAILQQWAENRAETGGHSFDLPDWADAYPEITPADPTILDMLANGERRMVNSNYTPFAIPHSPPSSGTKSVARASALNWTPSTPTCTTSRATNSPTSWTPSPSCDEKTRRSAGSTGRRGWCWRRMTN